MQEGSALEMSWVRYPPYVSKRIIKSEFLSYITHS